MVLRARGRPAERGRPLRVPGARGRLLPRPLHRPRPPYPERPAAPPARAAVAPARGRRAGGAASGGDGQTMTGDGWADETALAALAVLDGLSPRQAVGWVRAGFRRRAVETPWQRRWLAKVR
ncbi:MAG TPA: protein phosphatase [Actinomycetes bacterium]|nr:protein phosphatase [Actinomycetes bacterium]